MYSLRREDIVSGVTLVKSTYSPTHRYIYMYVSSLSIAGVFNLGVAKDF